MPAGDVDHAGGLQLVGSLGQALPGEGELPEVEGSSGNVQTAGQTDRLALVARLGQRQGLQVGVDHVGNLEEVAPPRLRAEAGPGWEGSGCCSDRVLHLWGAGVGEERHHLLSGGVQAGGDNNYSHYLLLLLPDFMERFSRNEPLHNKTDETIEMFLHLSITLSVLVGLNCPPIKFSKTRIPSILVA